MSPESGESHVQWAWEAAEGESLCVSPPALPLRGSMGPCRSGLERLRLGPLPEALQAVGSRPCPGPPSSPICLIEGRQAEWPGVLGLTLMPASRTASPPQGRPSTPSASVIGVTLQDPQPCREGLALTFFSLTRRRPLWRVPPLPLRGRKPRLRVRGTRGPSSVQILELL